MSELRDDAVFPLRRCASKAAKVMGLSQTPCTCPFAGLHGEAHPVVVRTTQALALMEKGLSESAAFPGGVTAVDRQALLILNAAIGARIRSDDLDRQREIERQRAQTAAKP